MATCLEVSIDTQDPSGIQIARYSGTVHTRSRACAVNSPE